MPRTRKHAWAFAAAGALCLAVAASGTGGTLASFSDVVVDDTNVAGAASVALGLPGGSTGPILDYRGLLPAESQSKSFTVAYQGTVPADLALELRPDGESAYCDATGADTWEAKPGGALWLSLGSGWVDYCGLLGSTVQVPVRSGVVPGTDLTFEVSLQLAPGTGYHYSDLSDADRLALTAHQPGTPGSGFSDFAVGTITIATGTIQPPIPAECGSPGGYHEVLSDIDGDGVVDGGNGKQILLGLDGDDVLDGGNGKDCLVGGDGDDLLDGKNGKDIMVGGNGVDTCDGGRALDSYSCELPVEPSSPEPAPTTPDGAAPGQTPPPPPVEDESPPPAGPDPSGPQRPAAQRPDAAQEPTAPDDSATSSP